MKASELESIRYRSRVGYPAVWKGRFAQAVADVSFLLAEVENLQRALAGFLAGPLPPGVQKAPVNDTGGTDAKEDEHGQHDRGDRQGRSASDRSGDL